MCKQCIIETNKWLESIGRLDMVVNISEHVQTFTPFFSCGWKDSDDGTCSHPENTTPECSQFSCPIKIVIT